MRTVDVARRGYQRGWRDFAPGRDVMVLAARRLDGVFLRFGCQPRLARLYSWSYLQGFEAAAATAQPANREE